MSHNDNANNTLTLAIPAHWAAPLINADLSGLDKGERIAFRRWYMDMIDNVGAVVPCHVGQEEFARYHDAAEYGVLPCMCVDVQFHVVENGLQQWQG